MTETKQRFSSRLGRFGRVRRGVANAALFYGVGAAALGVGIAALLLLCGWTEDPLVNAAVTLVGVGLLVHQLVRLIRGWERRRSAMSEAFRAEELAGGLNSRLISALDFLAQPATTPLTEVVIERAGRDLEQPFEQMLDRSARNRRRRRFIGLLVIFVALGSTPWFSFSRLGGTVARSAADLREILLPTRFEIFPGPGLSMYRIGTRTEAGLRFTRFRYPEVTLLRRSAGNEQEERMTLPVDRNGRAALTLEPTLEQEYRIRLAFGKRVSEEMHLVFTSAPLIENMQVELVYPLYTRLLPKESDGIQDRITALAGTRVNLGFVFTKPLEAAELTFDDASRLPLDVVGRFASVSFVHSQDRTAELQVKDVHGFAMDSPHRMVFGVTADKPPRLTVPKFLRADMPQTVEEFAGFTFGAKVEDDFGAAKCLVKWHKSTTDKPDDIKVRGEPVERAFIPPRPTAVAAFENLFREQAQSAAPGDLFTFQVQAFDNRQPDPQSTVSAMFSIFLQGRGPEDGTAGGGVNVMAKFAQFGGGGGAKRVWRPTEGSHVIGMPPGLTTAEQYRNEYTSERQTRTRSEVRGPRDKTVGDYGTAISGAE